MPMLPRAPTRVPLLLLAAALALGCHGCAGLPTAGPLRMTRTVAQAQPRPDEQDEPGGPASEEEEASEEKQGEAEASGEDEPGEEEPGIEGGSGSGHSASQPTARIRATRGRNVAWLITSAAAAGVGLGTFIGGITRTGRARHASERHDRESFEEAQTGQYALYAVAGTMAAVSTVSLLIFFFAGDGASSTEDRSALQVGGGPGEAGLSMEWRF